jgi:hypothetical protein
MRPRDGTPSLGSMMAVQARPNMFGPERKLPLAMHRHSAVATCGRYWRDGVAGCEPSLRQQADNASRG